jgi:Rhamnan synthesis protein F
MERNLNNLASPKIAPRRVQLAPERIYPTHAKPVRKKERFKWPDLGAWMRRRILDRREDNLGVSGRFEAQIEGENFTKPCGEALAIYSHYSSTGRVSAMVQSQIAAYAAHGFEVIFVSMCASLNEDDVGRLRKLCRAIVVRRSFGRDFGAWRDILSSDLVQRAPIRELLLVNDSVLGPIRPMEPLFETMRTADGLWGLINSDQNGSHLQTFFLLSRGGAAVDAVFDFFDRLALSTDKEIVVTNGELSFSSSIARRGVPLWSLYGLRQVEDAALSDRRSRLETVLTLGHIGLYRYVSRRPDASDDDLDVRIRNVMAGSPVNPTHHFGEVLVRRFDFPFIKTELLVVNPINMSIASTWRSLVTEESPCSVDMIVDHLCLL